MEFGHSFTVPGNVASAEQWVEDNCVLVTREWMRTQAEERDALIKLLRMAGYEYVGSDATLPEEL